MDSDSSQILILIMCIALSSFFSCSETALTSIDDIKLRTMVDERVKNAALVQKVLTDPSKMLSAILIGNNLVNIGASALATVLATKYLGNNAVGIATGILTLIILIFGEITPKTLAKEKNVEISVLVIKPIYLCTIIFTPVIFILNIITGALLRLITGNGNTAPVITENQFRTMLDVGHEQGILESEEKEMITNVVDFGDCEAKEVMIPRIDMVAVEQNTSLEEVIEVFKKERYTRLPVYAETTDHIVGILSFKDIMFIEDKEKFVINDYMKEPYFTYESKLCSNLFSIMKKERIPMAIVLDEYGGTAGIITLQDLIEEIVGDIIDEVREDTDDIIKVGENVYISKGNAKLDDVNDLIGTSLSYEDIETVGGYIIGKLGYFPKKGEKYAEDNISFDILEVGKNRIDKLKFTVNRLNDCA